MKRLTALILAVLLIILLTACGGGAKDKLVGVWKLTDGDDTTYGFGMEFKKDGTLVYGLTADIVAEMDDMSEKEADEALEALSYLYKIKYKIKDETTMQITVSALMGLAKESTDVTYSLEGDTLHFDGNTYSKVK